MDPWDVFSEMCRQVVTQQNVVLEVIIIDGAVAMSLAPIIDFDEEEEDGEI